MRFNSRRRIIVEAMLLQLVFTLVNLYDPSFDDPSFFSSINLKLANFNWECIVIGGDFNFVFNLEMDKEGGNPRTNFNAREKCKDLMWT